MRETLDLLRHERRGRILFAALAQSALGTGAGYVALLLIAYDRFDSPWAVSFVLIADLLPAMLLGPLFGALADRWSRKGCMVLADVLRVAAFAGIALVDSFATTVLFAAVAGVGTGLFTPAALASLPSVLDRRDRTPAATSLYGIVTEVGFTAGPALGALLLFLGGAETVMVANAVTFAVSAAILARLRFGGAPLPGDGHRLSLMVDIAEGVRATMGRRNVRIVLLASAAGLVCAGLFNVAELFFVTEDLGAGDVGFSILVTCFGVGVVAGSLLGSSGGPGPLLKRRYLVGLFALGLSLLLTGVASSFLAAVLTFTFAGVGNGLLLVYERLLVQATIPDRLVGRVFGMKDALTAWAFGLAFLAGGGLVTALGAREVILLAGGVAMLVFATAAVALRNEWRADDPSAGPPPAGGDAQPAALDGGADARSRGALDEDPADLVVGGEDLGLAPRHDAG